ncbi:hypothetical protein HYV84_07405 [Candidatus Woesearchaeota archaeon]|nr:hypothetical protein [Candidatus Woesearchaeota archaeon]
MNPAAKKIFPIVLAWVFLLIIPVESAQVCTVAFFSSDKAASKCLDVPDNSNAVESFQKAGLSLGLSGAGAEGRKICKVEGVGSDPSGNGCSSSEKAWTFAMVDGSQWRKIPAALDGGSDCWNRDFSFNDPSKIVHYCALDGDTIGIAFGEPGTFPDMLSLDDVRAVVDGITDSGVNRTELKIDANVTPLSQVEVKFELKNLFDSGTDVDIENIEIDARIKDIDDDADIDVDLDRFDLNPGEEKNVAIPFSIPMIVVSNTYDMDVIITAKDKLGISYRKELDFIIEVTKERHRLVFTDMKLDKPFYSCEKSFGLSFTIVNIGSKDEPVALEVKHDILGIGFNDSFHLNNDPFEEGSTAKRAYTIPFNTQSPSGSYPLNAHAFYEKKVAVGNSTFVKKDCTVGKADSPVKEMPGEKKRQGEKRAVSASPPLGEEEDALPIVEEDLGGSSGTFSVTPLHFLVAGFTVIGLIMLGTITLLLVKVLLKRRKN